MAQQRSDRLRVVLQMEERREVKAQQALQVLLAKHEQEHNQLQELEKYHQDYQGQIRQQHHLPQSSRQLLGWQQFLNQMSLAIEQQQRQVQRVQARLDEARAVWRMAWEKRAAMARHIEACRLQERQEADRREQKSVDEAANLRYGRASRR